MCEHPMMRIAATAALAAATLASPAVRANGTVGDSCYALACRAEDAGTRGGSAFGHGSVAGYARNHGGSCVGHDCQAGNGGTSGGDCYGDRCRAGDAHTHGGDCYGDGCRGGDAGNVGGDCYGPNCVPGKGEGRNGQAHPAVARRNVECLLGLVYLSSKERPHVLEHLKWYATGAANCGPIVKPVVAPQTLPAVAPRTPLPVRDWPGS